MVGLYARYKKDASQGLADCYKWGVGLVAGHVAYSLKKKEEKA